MIRNAISVLAAVAAFAIAVLASSKSVSGLNQARIGIPSHCVADCTLLAW